MFMVDRVRRRQPENEILLVGDDGYAAVALVQRCQRLKKNGLLHFSPAFGCNVA